MVFSNTLFIYLFLPLNLLIYFLVKDIKAKNITLLVFSLIFYSWGEPKWIILLLFTSIINYYAGIFIEKNKDTKKSKKWLIYSIIINLCSLLIFKYTAFIFENINELFNLAIKIPDIPFPLGISFYTFHVISYTVDVYKGHVKAQKSYYKFLLYISLYPQLVAGPIVRYSQVEDEIDYRESSIDNINDGINRFIVGLGKKVLIANVAGKLVEQYMNSNLYDLTVVGAWLGIVMFTIQMYFDFSGYSDMAIGLGKIFGFKYLENFNYPYISKSATEFWRRWHISLGSFFRDYVYIPLGGNKKNMVANLFIVWLLTGIWHGASWNFIVWGLYFGIIIYFEKKFILKILNRIPKIVSHIYLLIVVVSGWTIFYFTNLTDSIKYLKIMFGLSNNSIVNTETKLEIVNNIFWIILALIGTTPILPYIKRKLLEKDREYILTILVVIINVMILILSTAMLIGDSYNPFLYFRF
ncbi:MBOAT family protein [Clostridium senegalense]|uniref:MBOAT family O-acyltransferase n=1 Tax=Clostridium senegalense TaxID=1465809 RepID=UPI001C124C24|nr:MBOAT family O-acyltransferase [Clostridium senegalense]MBU5226288.1 MBOAT family protein [Clostridium senegalense]